MLADATGLIFAVSLVLFCIAFVSEASTLQAAHKRLLFWPFVIAEGVHILLRAALIVATAGLPPLLALPLLAWGLVNYAWVIVTLVSRWGRGGRLVVPGYVTWYLWSLFVGTSVLRGDAIGSGAWALIGIAVIAAITRIVLNLKAR